VTAPAGVPVLFGSRWAGSVILIQLFTLVAAAQLLISPAGQLMKALGRPGWMFAWSVFFTAVVLLLLASGSTWGIEGIGFGLALAHIIGIGVAGTLITRLIGARWTDLGRAALPGLALAIGSGGIALVFLRFLPGPASLRLAVAAAAGVLVMALGLRRLSPAVWGAVTSGFGLRRRDPGAPVDGMLESITSERGP
jgi:O-antigen/teichoic acid export membrane protein